MKYFRHSNQGQNFWNCVTGLLCHRYVQALLLVIVSVGVGFITAFNLRLRNFIDVGNEIFLATAAAGELDLAKASSGKTDKKAIEMIDEAISVIKQVYIKDVTDEEAFEYSVNGVLTSLDPHSAYLNKQDYSEIKNSIYGKFGGLGIEVTSRDSFVLVIAAIEDTPAAKAGIKSGDYIIEIDGESIYNFGLTEAVKRMRGKPGTTVKLTIVRQGVSEPLHFTLKREMIEYKHVRSDFIDGVLYFKVNSFSEIVADKMQQAVAETVKKYGQDRIKGVVLDLRNNPGGLLNAAVDVSGLFLPKGTNVVSVKGRNMIMGEENRTLNEPIAALTDAPLVVLINSGSASASEIVAGALHDHQRAVLMGEKSFGKGSVQRVIPLRNGGALKITVALYYTPNGVSIQAEGIVPDIEVPFAKVDVPNRDDFISITEDKLLGHLENGSAKGKNKKKKKRQDIEMNKEELRRLEMYKQDYQLSRALDLIKSVAIYRNAIGQTVDADAKSATKSAINLLKEKEQVK